MAVRRRHTELVRVAVHEVEDVQRRRRHREGQHRPALTAGDVAERHEVVDTALGAGRPGQQGCPVAAAGHEPRHRSGETALGDDADGCGRRPDAPEVLGGHLPLVGVPVTEVPGLRRRTARRVGEAREGGLTRGDVALVDPGHHVRAGVPDQVDLAVAGHHPQAGGNRRGGIGRGGLDARTGRPLPREVVTGQPELVDVLGDQPLGSIAPARSRDSRAAERLAGGHVARVDPGVLVRR